MNTDNLGIYDARQLGKPKFAILLTSSLKNVHFVIG